MVCRAISARAEIDTSGKGVGVTITGGRRSPLDGQTVQQGVEARPGHLNRYRSGRRLVVALVHQEVPILTDFVDVIPDVRRDRPALLDASRPINEVSRTDPVVGIPRDVATVRAERRLEFGPHPDQVGRLDLVGRRDEVAGRRPRRQLGVADQGERPVVGDGGGHHVRLPLRALDTVDERLAFSH